MSTYLTLEDGRVLGTSNGIFDAIVELVAAELSRRPVRVAGLAEWLLDQRCAIQGPGVGYLDLRELSPLAAREFREAFLRAYRSVDVAGVSDNLREDYTALKEMWASIDRGEPPDALTSKHWLRSPPTGERHGPGW